MPSHRAVARTLVAALAVACSPGTRDDHTDEETRPAAAAAVAGAAAAGAGRGGEPSFVELPGGEVAMFTRDRSLMLRLRNDSILAGFSDSLRTAVKSEVERKSNRPDTGERSEFGRAIERVVRTTVNATLSEVFDKDRGVPVSDLRDARLENGTIVFDYRRKPTLSFDSIKLEKEPFLSQFHRADAARFVGAVRARLNTR